LVQANGLWFWFEVSIQARMSAAGAATLVRIPRRISSSVIRPKERTVWVTEDGSLLALVRAVRG
jgi:hypothetical protein